MVRCGSKNKTKRHIFAKDWTTCSDYDNHSKLHSQDDYKHLHDHVMSTRILTLIMLKVFIRAPRIVRKVVLNFLTISY